MKPTVAFRNSLAPAPKNEIRPKTWVQSCKTETLKRQEHGKTSEISMPEQYTFFIIRLIDKWPSLHQYSNTEAQNVPEPIMGVIKATDTGFQKNQYWLILKD
jgi:hypothetical protein